MDDVMMSWRFSWHKIHVIQWEIMAMWKDVVGRDWECVSVGIRR
jgi:hypothetical protein